MIPRTYKMSGEAATHFYSDVSELARGDSDKYWAQVMRRSTTPRTTDFLYTSQGMAVIVDYQMRNGDFEGATVSLFYANEAVPGSRKLEFETRIEGFLEEILPELDASLVSAGGRG